MSGYLIGEVCQALDVKPHILRYWEQQIPLLRPRKDQAGRRLYSARELQILYRLRYLIRVRRLTTEGAARKLTEELNGAGRRTGIQLLRENLLRLHGSVRAWQRTAQQKPELPPEVAESQPLLRAAWSRLTARERSLILEQLAFWNAPERKPVYTVQIAGARGLAGNEPPAIQLQPWRKPVPQQWLAVASPRAVLVTIGGGAVALPAGRAGHSAAQLHDSDAAAAAVGSTVLEQRAREVMHAVSRSGMQLASWIVAQDWGSDAPSSASHLIQTRPLPVLDRNGRYFVSPRGLGALSYQCRLLVVARTLVYGPLRSVIQDADLVVLDLPFVGVPGPAELPLLFDPGKTDAVAAATAAFANKSTPDRDATQVRNRDGRMRYALCGTIAVSPDLLISTLQTGTGTMEIMRGVGTDDTQDSDIRVSRLRIVDLLRHARRPRLFLLQENG